jgi:hypothetical protein
MISKGSLNLKLLRMYRARRRGYRMGLLGTPETFGEGVTRRLQMNFHELHATQT